MQKVEDYLWHAEECRMLAGRARSPAEREMLLNMAETWHGLATARRAQVAQLQRMKDIAAGPGGDDRMSSGSIPVDELNASNRD
jgi:hypothetical protein